MRSKYVIPFVVVLLLALTFTGCRTTRSAGGAIALTKKQKSELLTPLAEYPTEVKSITAKTSVSLGEMGDLMSIKGRLRMRRDEVIQMTFTALGLMEIARIEFTPERVCIIDRINKRYALFDYSSGMANYAGINFGTIQSLFWNRLFIPGEKRAWKETDNFSLIEAGTQRLVEPSRQRMLKCQFYTDTDCKQLQQTDLAIRQYSATWRYGEFESFGTYSYPTVHDISVSGMSYDVGARIALSGVSIIDTEWSGTTDLSRYKEVDFEQLLSILNMIK